MMATLRLPLVLLSLATMSVAAHAQASDWAGVEVYPGYPGSFLVTPQRSDFTAPAIYRSVNDRNNLGNPVEIKKLCSRDIELLIRKGTIHTRKADASGVQNARTIAASGKIGLDAKILQVNAGAQYDQVVSLSTGPVQVFDSEEDDVGRIILAHISRGCRDLIGHHLMKQRVVFVAETAIQAFDYDATVERVTAGTAAAQCGFFSWCRWIGAKGEITARFSSSSHNLARNTYVTIAMVPAEIGDRQSLTYADIGRTAVLSPEAPVYAFATAVHGKTRAVQGRYEGFENRDGHPKRHARRAKPHSIVAMPSMGPVASR